MVRAGPWAVAAELVLWLAVVPLMLAYWLVSQDLPEAFIAPVLAAAAILAGAACSSPRPPAREWPCSLRRWSGHSWCGRPSAGRRGTTTRSTRRGCRWPATT